MRIASRVLIEAGVLLLVWAIAVWRWQDPFTALYTHWQQEKLSRALDHEFAAYSPSPATRSLALAAQRDAVATEAARFRRSTHSGEAIGRIVIGRIGLDMVVVDGTDESALRKGPAAISARTCRDKTASCTSRDTERHTSRRSRTSTTS